MNVNKFLETIFLTPSSVHNCILLFIVQCIAKQKCRTNMISAARLYQFDITTLCSCKPLYYIERSNYSACPIFTKTRQFILVFHR